MSLYVKNFKIGDLVQRRIVLENIGYHSGVKKIFKHSDSKIYEIVKIEQWRMILVELHNFAAGEHLILGSSDIEIASPTDIAVYLRKKKNDDTSKNS